MTETCAILLAAGVSQRMGAPNKLLLPVEGRPMIRGVAEVYCAALGAGAVHVVTGHQADDVQAALQGLPLRFVHNPDYAEGQPGSVTAGLRAVPPCDEVLIGLGDQPLLTADDLRALLAAHRTADPSKITIPYDGAQRGNPVVIPGALLPRILADGKNPNCGRYTRTHPDETQMLPMAARGFFHDVDTPHAFVALTGTAPEETVT